MESYQLVTDYRDNENLKESFNALAMKTFNIDFRRWYNKGYWNDSYVPYSFVDGGKVIANASVTKMSVIIKGKRFSAIQIGTVMTDEMYRNQGLSKKLMQQILDEHENTSDFMYLFANETVLDFYPKFGFTRLHESEFSVDLAKNPIQINHAAQVKKLSIEEDLVLLETYAKNRYVNSTILDVEHNESLLLFYFTLVFNDAIHYIEEFSTIVLMEEEEGTLHIYDIVSLEAPSVEGILASICKETTEKVVFYFTPDFAIEGILATMSPNDHDALFILTKQKLLKGNFMLPLTSHS